MEDIDKDIPPINNKKEEKKEKEKDEKDKENFLISNENKQDKSRNFKQDNKIKNDSNDVNENIKSDESKKIIEDNNNIKKEKMPVYNLKNIVDKIPDINIFSKKLTDEIIKEIISSEIQ